jgi:hypothetical protein
MSDVKAAPWGVRRRQALAVARQTARAGLRLRSGLGLWLMALAPVGMVALHALVDHHCRIEQDTVVMGGLIQVYYLRLAIFFGCLVVFGRLFRGEIVQRTLHHGLLAPLRREVLVVGRFLGATLGTAVVFGLGVFLTFTLMFAHLGVAGRAFVFQGGCLAQLGAYLLVSTMACLGFGAVFLVLGLVFRNPAVPAIFYLSWETFGGILPGWMQRLSVTFYLKPLLPVGLPDVGLGSLLGVVVEPVPGWLAVTGLLLFAAAVVAAACWRVRRLEVNYATD